MKILRKGFMAVWIMTVVLGVVMRVSAGEFAEGELASIVEDLYRSKLDAPIEESFPLKPYQHVDRCLYNVETKSTFGSTAGYSHAFFTVMPGTKYLVSGSAATSSFKYPLCAVYDKDGNILARYGTKPSAVYSEYPVIVPEGAETMVVNADHGIVPEILEVVSQDHAYIQKLQEKISQQQSEIEALKKNSYSLDYADALLREADKNPFQLAPFEKGYVTFVFDDLTEDLDSVASIFEEYGYPFCVAAIPSRLDLKATELREARGSFYPGMSMREILDRIVQNGGEVMAHNAGLIIREDNQDDYGSMYTYFVESKKTLEEAGYHVRGIIRAGGDGAVSGTPQIEQWLIGNYEYSNMGTAVNYRQDRTDINQEMEILKETIRQTVAARGWCKFMCHGYYFGNGLTFTGEEDLREILDYCRTIGVTVCTYAHIFDTYSSSMFLETMRGNR